MEEEDLQFILTEKIQVVPDRGKLAWKKHDSLERLRHHSFNLEESKELIPVKKILNPVNSCVRLCGIYGIAEEESILASHPLLPWQVLLLYVFHLISGRL